MNSQELGYDDDVEIEQQQPQERQNVEAATPQQNILQPRPKLVVIPTDKQGLIAPQDSEQEFRFARMLLDTGAVPSCFETPQQVVLGVQMCRALGVAPALGIRQIMVVPKHNTL